MVEGSSEGARLPRHRSVAGHPEIVEDIALLLAQGIAHREQALYEAAAIGTVGAEAGVTPQHPMTKGSFGFVVGRLDALCAHEGPQGRPEVEEVGAGGCRLGVGELLIEFERPLGKKRPPGEGQETSGSGSGLTEQLPGFILLSPRLRRSGP